MNIFSPYILLEDSPSKIHLKKNDFRKNLHLFVLRFFPVVFLSAAVFLLIASSPVIPKWFNVFMIIALIIAAFLVFSRRLITEVLITKTEIEVIYYYFLEEVNEVISCSFY